MNRTAATAVINGVNYTYSLTGHRGDWNWICPDGQRAGYAAGGATKTTALANLRINLRNDEPGFTSLEWS